MQAGGNDFILIDNRKSLIKNRKKSAMEFCQRKFSVGADGLLLLENSKTADFRMRIFNPDGTEAEMCGNGVRCLIKFIRSKKLHPHLLPPPSRGRIESFSPSPYVGRERGRGVSIQTADGIYFGKVQGDLVSVKMRKPGEIRLNLRIKIKQKGYTLHFINFGVPHTIIFVDDLKKVDLKNIAPLIRNHQKFAPCGTNVDFVKVVDYHSLLLRTYERGVEEETFSCGTGSSAAAIISYKFGKVNSPVKVSPTSGEPLKLFFDAKLKEIYLEGKANEVYKGECY